MSTQRTQSPHAGHGYVVRLPLAAAEDVTSGPDGVGTHDGEGTVHLDADELRVLRERDPWDDGAAIEWGHGGPDSLMYGGVRHHVVRSPVIGWQP